MDGKQLVFNDMLTRWPDVVEAGEEIAAEYHDDGWEAVAVNPGHVTVLPDDYEESGLWLTLPDNEIEAVQAITEVQGADFSTSIAFRNVSEEGVVYLLTVVRDEEREAAVIVPAYYDLGQADRLREEMERISSFQLHLVPLSEEPRIFFELDDIDRFFPTESDEE